MVTDTSKNNKPQNTSPDASFWDIIETNAYGEERVVYTTYGFEAQVSNAVKCLDVIRGDSDATINYRIAD